MFNFRYLKNLKLNQIMKSFKISDGIFKVPLIVLFLVSFYSLTAQEKTYLFETHQILYYETENFPIKENKFIRKYHIIHQNLREKGKYAIYSINSFNEEKIIFRFYEDFKKLNITSNHIPTLHYRAASKMELEQYTPNYESVERSSEIKARHKFLKKENEIKDNRMLTAYHFRVKNWELAKYIVYYIDHASSGIPFSEFREFYTEMEKEGFPLIGNVVVKETIDYQGNHTFLHLKKIEPTNKEISFLFVPEDQEKE